MRVLVLGAGGFVGRRTVAALAASSWATPVAGVRRGYGPSAVEQSIVDATDRAGVATALETVDAVVNCVSGDAATMIAAARALAAAPRRRVVQLSSMAVYGSAIGTLDEDAPLRADTGPYAIAKKQAEHVLRDGGSDAVLLRPGCIYGPGSTQWSLRVAALLATRRIGDLGANGDGCSNIVHVDDVVAAILAALVQPAGGRGVFNLAMAGAPDWNSYFLAFARALGTVPIARVPAWRMTVETTALAVPLRLVERTGAALRPAIPPSLARLWRQDIRLDATRASDVLGIGWTPLETGIADAASWCRTALRPARTTA